MSARRTWIRWLAAWLVLACFLPAPLAAQEAEGEPQVEIVPPETLTMVDPAYPETAMLADVEADVVLQIDIDVEGVVSNIVPLELVYYTYDDEGRAQEDVRDVTDDPYGFVEPALTAMAQYRFSPARSVTDENPVGERIPVRVTWRIGFVIDYEEQVVEVPVAASEGSGEEVGEIDGAGLVVLSGETLLRGYRTPLAAMVVEASGVGANDGLTATAVTDEDGRFSFRGLPPGEWRVRIEAAGYDTFDAVEVIASGERTEVRYFVEEDSRGVVVSRTVEQAPAREVTRRRLEVTEIQRIPGNNNDAIRVVQNLPGVARPSFNGGDVIVRGSEPDETQFFLDGMRIPAVYHFGGLRAVFPSELLSEINFYPGGFGAEFGRATGGVIDVRTAEERPDRVDGHVDINLFDSGAYLRAPVSERVHLEFGVRRSYIDAILRPLAPALGLNLTTAPRYYDYQARLVAELGDRNRLSVLVYGSDDRLDLVLDDEEDLDPQFRGGIRTTIWFHGVQAHWTTDLSDTLQNRMSVQVVGNQFAASLGQELFIEVPTTEYAFRDTLTWTPSDAVQLRYGMDIVYNDGEIELNLPRPPKEGEEPLDFGATETLFGREDVSIYEPSQFVDARLTPVEGLTLLPGFRMDYHRPPERWSFDPRLAVRYALTESVLLKGSVGSYHQPPNPEETSSSFGNPNLGLEHAIHYVVGTELQFTEHLRLSVDGFYKDIGGLTSRSSELVERNGEVVPEVYNNGADGRVYGAEFLLRHDFDGRFFGWVAYTLSRSERRDAGETDWRLFDFDQTHILTMLGSYRLPRNWSIGARWRLVTGNPTTDIVDAVYDSDNDTYVRVPGVSNAERTRTFHQLDVRVDKRWIRDRWTLNVYLDLQNAYNRMNQEGVSFNYDYTEQADLTGLPLIPALGVRAEF